MWQPDHKPWSLKSKILNKNKNKNVEKNCKIEIMYENILQATYRKTNLF